MRCEWTSPKMAHQRCDDRWQGSCPAGLLNHWLQLFGLFMLMVRCLQPLYTHRKSSFTRSGTFGPTTSARARNVANARSSVSRVACFSGENALLEVSTRMMNESLSFYVNMRNHPHCVIMTCKWQDAKNDAAMLLKAKARMQCSDIESTVFWLAGDSPRHAHSLQCFHPRPIRLDAARTRLYTWQRIFKWLSNQGVRFP